MQNIVVISVRDQNLLKHTGIKLKRQNQNNSMLVVNTYFAIDLQHSSLCTKIHNACFSRTQHCVNMYKYVNNSTPNRQSLWHLAIGVDQELDFSRFTENGVKLFSLE